jgi:hypothetical protein
MKARIRASPTDRCTSRSSSPATRKYSERRPSRANALTATTRYGSSVTPNTAGIESKANSRSVPPIAASTTNIGVTAQFRLDLGPLDPASPDPGPSVRVSSRPSW